MTKILKILMRMLKLKEMNKTREGRPHNTTTSSCCGTLVFKQLNKHTETLDDFFKLTHFFQAQ